MRLTAEDFEPYLREDDGEPLGEALATLAVDLEPDAVAAVRAVRERRRGPFSIPTYSSPR